MATFFLNLLPAIAIAATLLASPPAAADSYSPSHSCSKPYKPYQFDSQGELDQFQHEVSRYRRCIEEFVEEQNEEAKNHQDAAEEAIDEWNRFVRFELN